MVTVCWSRPIQPLNTHLVYTIVTTPLFELNKEAASLRIRWYFSCVVVLPLILLTVSQKSLLSTAASLLSPISYHLQYKKKPFFSITNSKGISINASKRDFAMTVKPQIDAIFPNQSFFGSPYRHLFSSLLWTRRRKELQRLGYCLVWTSSLLQETHGSSARTFLRMIGWQNYITTTMDEWWARPHRLFEKEACERYASFALALSFVRFLDYGEIP